VPQAEQPVFLSHLEETDRDRTHLNRGQLAGRLDQLVPWMVVTCPQTAITGGLLETSGKPGPGSRFGLVVRRTAITVGVSFHPFS
jgi:hypothetical protein